ncbi:MAG: glycosyltransferase family 2 protein [Dehalococcoidia bacterium]
MNLPMVSVLTPSFNQAAWLGDNLRSVATQTYPRIEHVVMDGGSTDGSVELLRAAAGRDGSPVHFRSEPDRGQSHALNKAFAESRGEIIGWLNSDDAYFDRGAVGAVVKFFLRHPEVDVVYGHSALVNASGLILQMNWAPPYSRRLFRLHNFIIQPAAFIRRRALGDFVADEAYDYAMDRELWLRLAQHGTLARIDRVLAIDRHHLQRKSLSRPDLARVDYEMLRDAYGVRSGTRRARIQLKPVKVAFRLLGLTLVPAATRPLAFTGGVDSPGRLAWRQMAVKRAAMPAEGGLIGAPPVERIAQPAVR